MPRGGRRINAGRKKGSLQKRTRKIAEKAIEKGETPLEVMLENMKHFVQVARDAEAVLSGLTYEEFMGKAGMNITAEEQFAALLAEVKKTAGFRQLAQDAAKDAAPYVHPRLAAVEHSGNVALTHEQLLDQLDD